MVGWRELSHTDPAKVRCDATRRSFVHTPGRGQGPRPLAAPGDDRAAPGVTERVMDDLHAGAGVVEREAAEPRALAIELAPRAYTFSPRRTARQGAVDGCAPAETSWTAGPSSVPSAHAQPSVCSTSPHRRRSPTRRRAGSRRGHASAPGVVGWSGAFEPAHATTHAAPAAIIHEALGTTLLILTQVCHELTSNRPTRWPAVRCRTSTNLGTTLL